MKLKPLNFESKELQEGTPNTLGSTPRWLTHKKFEKHGIDKMLAMGVITLAQTEWDIPIVLTPKKYVTLEIYENYRRLSAVAVQEVYPILCMDECIEALGKATIFSTPDANSGY